MPLEGKRHSNTGGIYLVKFEKCLAITRQSRSQSRCSYVLGAAVWSASAAPALAIRLRFQRRDAMDDWCCEDWCISIS